VQSGLKNDDGLGPIAYELQIASHLVSQGFDVGFHDLEGGGGFDFLVTGPATLEIECKHVSADIGRQIHQRALMQFEARIRPLLLEMLHRHGSGHLKIVIPARLTADGIQERQIGEAVRALLNQNSSSVETQAANVQFSPLTCPMRFNGSALQRRRALHDALGPQNAHHIIADSGAGAMVLTIRSRKPDKVLATLVERLKDDAKRQFSGSAPAVFCVHIPDLTTQDLHDLLNEERVQVTGVQAAFSHLLRRRPHLHTVALTVDPVVELSRERPIVLPQRGLVLVRRNEQHPDAANPALNIFSRGSANLPF
jgi:hypothetical protein